MEVRMKKKLFVVLLSFALLAVSASVYAWWLHTYYPVSSCSDSDGLDFRNKGFINITGNLTGTFYDYCVDNVTVAEMACSKDVYNVSGYAIEIRENCLNLTNSTGCSLGRCI